MMILTVVFYFFLACTGIQIIYYLCFSPFIFRQKKIDKKTESSPVSAILDAKNSTAELHENLPFVIAQTYPIFEIVLIDNAYSDDISEIMEVFQEKNENIKIVAVKNTEAFWSNKKYPLTLGKKSAKYDHLLCTDANSKPIRKSWIFEMSAMFTLKRTIFLGYEKFKSEKTFTNLLIRFYSLLQALKCFSFAKITTLFMAFGRNLAYTKSEFFKVNGFINHIKIIYGEDDLFIRDAGSKKNIAFSISEDSFIEMEPHKSFKEWFQYVRITNSLRVNYKFKHRFLLSLFIFSKTFFYVLAIVLFFFYSMEIIGFCILAYVLVQYLVIGFSAKKTKRISINLFLTFFRNWIIIDSN